MIRIAFLAATLLLQPALVRAEGTPSAVVAKKVGAGWVFTDTKGMTLYTYAQDKPGVSNCKGPCATLWPPLLASSTDAAVLPDWSVVERADGAKQIAYRGMPLYGYTKDTGPGTSFGDAGAWRVAGADMDTPPGIAIGRSLEGRVLTDHRGRTLYFNADDKPSDGAIAKLKSACTKRCLESWKPLIAPSVAVAKGDWSVVVREDGLRQWAFAGKPLYARGGEVEGADARLWHAALVESAPAVPSWVTYQQTDAGELVADAKGLTIYALTTAQPGARVQDFKSPTVCDAACIQTYWRPVVAAGDAKPVGNWTVVKGSDGASQWAYKGELLFTHARDKEPGELAGARFFTRAWHTLPRAGGDMEGMDKR